MKICPVGAELFHADERTDRQTDRMKITVAVWNFVKAPKIKTLSVHIKYMDLVKLE